MKEAYIYTYVNKETKKTYIGARCNYKGSCYDDFNIKYFSSSKDKEFRKDMADGKLEGKIVLVMNDDNADKKIFEVEAKMIKAYWDKYGKKNSYNHYAGGEFNTAGRHQNVGRHLSDETRAKISASMKDRKVSDEARKKMSETRKGRISNMKGKKMSDESREKISNSLKGKPSWNKGKKMSDEYCIKMSIAHKGKKLSDETCKKMSISQKLIYKNPPKWITPDGEIKMMNARNVKQYHPDWKLIEK